MYPGVLSSHYIIFSAIFYWQFRETRSKQGFLESDKFIEKVVQHEIVVREGEDTRIPCEIQPGSQDRDFNDISDRPTLIIWYKKDQHLPIYSLDLRRYSQDYRGAPWRNNDTTERGEIHYEENGKVRRSHLFLPTVTREDGGKYRCRVDYVQYPTRNSWVKLKVIVGPSKPQLLDGLGLEVVGSVMVGLGEPVSLLCQTKGIPFPTILWKLKGNPLQPISYHTDTLSGVVQSRVRLEQQRQELDGAIIQCEASNSDRASEPVVSQVVVRVLAPPASVQISRSEEFFNLGRRYNVSCTVSGLNIEPAVSISFQNNPLSIQTLQERSLGEWVATAEVYPTQGDILLERTQGFQWNQDTFSPSSNDDDDKKESIGRYTDQQSTRLEYHVVPQVGEDIHVVGCQGSNPLLPQIVLHDQWNISVHYGPYVKLELENTEKIKEGDNIFLNCQVLSYPPYQTIQWIRQNEDLEYQMETNVMIRADRLYIRNITREQGGKYVCRASNKFSSQRSNILDIEISERWVWEVRDCKTVNQSSSSFLIDCLWSGADQQKETVFIFEVMKSGTRELIANVSTDVPSLFVSQLPPSTDFIVTVRSGMPGAVYFSPISMETFTLRSEEQLATTTRISNPGYIRFLPMVGILLGLLLILSVLPISVHLLVKHRDISNLQRQGMRGLEDDGGLLLRTMETTPGTPSCTLSTPSSCMHLTTHSTQPNTIHTNHLVHQQRIPSNSNTIDLTDEGSSTTHQLLSSYLSSSSIEERPIPPPPSYSTPVPLSLSSSSSSSYPTSVSPPEHFQSTGSTSLSSKSNLKPMESSSLPISTPEEYCSPLPNPNTFTPVVVRTSSLENINSPKTKTTFYTYQTMDRKPLPTIQVFQDVGRGERVQSGLKSILKERHSCGREKSLMADQNC
ncbi:uncharacterized protein LOC111717898 [Eurytemora carolleeae]|uniref:uncharacterized protein LOC111717898 n=1 Tax=Eurytemora carolleeae TaxID=1294199 RepID=UPI000C78AD9B|nr:uncharacterized protein LOC111717898 [Eurytemora carolleeae]|eukprot:XP_023349131.1 uncharacterized protein LOC111717898 [Eurytemora affinis]